MRANFAIGMLAAVAMLAGCGGSDEPEADDESLKVEDTAFGPLVGTQDKARDRANAAVDQHREDMNERLERDEGADDREDPAGD